MVVTWSPEAIDDIERIYGHLVELNPAAAARIAAELLVGADSLVMFPHRGRPGLLPGRRELVAIRPYVLVYRVLPGGSVDILRVWHSAQDR